jgi:hypothetical protein
LSELGETAAFRSRLQASLDIFRRDEALLREQYAREADAGNLPAGDPPPTLLERPTRRYLIDDFLRALDWDPGAPAEVSEEARSTSSEGENLFFDYLGIAPRTRAPVLLVEAKAFDEPAAREPFGSELDAEATRNLLAGAIDVLKRGDRRPSIIAKWIEWLNDLRSYIGSLGTTAQTTLHRVVITSGRWMVIFQEPPNTFTGTAPCNVEHIHCFSSPEDIIERHQLIFRLLQRRRLVDTLDLTLSVDDAFEILKPTSIASFFRGALVVTKKSGSLRGSYPTRSVYPALIVNAGGRFFAVADYQRVAEEPKDRSGFGGFVAEIERNGEQLERRLKESLGLRDLAAQPIESFPGFSPSVLARGGGSPRIAPVEGSTADNLDAQERRSYITHAGDAAVDEYLVTTGVRWFYKRSGPECRFHFHTAARDENVATRQPHSGPGERSFTNDGQDQHCAHEDLRRTRSLRCHIDPLETHLCCRGCIFFFDCWATDEHRMPCPQGSTVVVHLA